MGKATVEYPFTDICGKVNKTDNAYFCHRNGKTFIRRIKNPHKGEPSPSQQASKEKFKRAIGMALAHKIITLHQGKIEVKSKSGHGTTFCVEIPNE